jgi:hypothetical protein
MPSTVFISYSHRDRHWKNLLIRQLGVLETKGLLATWHDGLIQLGADWLTSIEQAMADARIAVFLVSADFLSSEFVRRKEVPLLMERRRTEGLRVLRGRGSATACRPPAARRAPMSPRPKARGDC